MSPEIAAPAHAPDSAVNGTRALWASALRQVAVRDQAALKTLRWAALIALPPMAQTIANYCDFHLHEAEGRCFALFDEFVPGVGCSDLSVLEPWHLFCNSLAHGLCVLPAAVPTYAVGWNRLGRLTIMSLATFILLSKFTGAGLLDPRGFLSLLRMLGWQIATTEMLLPMRAQ